MRLVIFPLTDYANQLKIDFSSIFSLIYPFDVVETSEYFLIVKKKDLDNVYFQINLEHHAKIWNNNKNPIIVVSKFTTNTYPNLYKLIYFENHGEAWGDPNQNYDKFYKVLTSASNPELPPNTYGEPLLHFTRNFYFYGFHFNPPLYDFTLKYDGNIPNCMVYSGRLDSQQPSKAGYRTEFIKELKQKYPQHIFPKIKTDDFKKCNLNGINEDFKNNGWYWDFNKSHSFLVFETADINDRINHFYSEKTFRALMSGNMIILGISTPRHKQLIDAGFWTPTNEVIDKSEDAEELLFETFEYLNKEGFNIIKSKNIEKIKNNQRILYDWFYKDQPFKTKAIEWILEDDNR